eukprot:TRINITY_DN12224_c0_g1_i2.p1 TRINITY_DN12224_c0_g1~~TRINITY_DN12224_c0_g1_i2.p1  ORF type:complete len:369 (-),score=84.98 TRINITY_DN12224_c0_g1_i2:263-1369(-)
MPVTITTLCCCLVTTHTQEVHVTEKCGTKHRILEPGISCINPCICEKVVASQTLKDTMMEIVAEVKTLDDAICDIAVELVSRVIDFQEMYYTLQSPSAQKRAYVEDSLRAKCAMLTIEQLFADKQAIAEHIRRDVQEDLQPYGIKVVGLLLTDVKVTRELKAAMTRKKVASCDLRTAMDVAEANKIGVVKQAEARADAEALAGSGTARERQAMLDGVRASIASFHHDNPDVSPQECYDTVLLLQYLQTLKDAGGDKETLTLPYGGGSVEWLHADLEAKRAKSSTKYHIEEGCEVVMKEPKRVSYLEAPSAQHADETAGLLSSPPEAETLDEWNDDAGGAPAEQPVVEPTNEPGWNDGEDGVEMGTLQM